jgi:hypothetical protein
MSQELNLDFSKFFNHVKAVMYVIIVFPKSVEHVKAVAYIMAGDVILVMSVEIVWLGVMSFLVMSFMMVLFEVVSMLLLCSERSFFLGKLGCG